MSQVKSKGRKTIIPKLMKVYVLTNGGRPGRRVLVRQGEYKNAGALYMNVWRIYHHREGWHVWMENEENYQGENNL